MNTYVGFILTNELGDPIWSAYWPENSTFFISFDTDLDSSAGVVFNELNFTFLKSISPGSSGSVMRMFDLSIDFDDAPAAPQERGLWLSLPADGGELAWLTLWDGANLRVERRNALTNVVNITGSEVIGFSEGGTGWVLTVRVYLSATSAGLMIAAETKARTVTGTAPYTDITVLGLSGSSGIYTLTTAAGDYRQGFFPSDPDISLGAVTASQLAAGTYRAGVSAQTDEAALVWGCFPHPTLGTKRVIATADGGVTWTAVDDWADGYCAALAVTAAGAVFAVSVSGSTATLYTGTAAGLRVACVLPFTPTGGGLDVWPDGTLAAGNGAGGGVMVAVCPPPYLAWRDVSGDYPTGAGIKRIVTL